MKVVLASSNSQHRRTGISFRSLFMYILGTISEGFQRVASHCADRTCLYLVRLENYGAHDPASVFIDNTSVKNFLGTRGTGAVF